jgi:hypothetical protein
MTRLLINDDYLKFRIWLSGVVNIDPYDFADWLHGNAASLWTGLEEGWTQDDVGAWLRERYVSERRLNIYPRPETQS